MLVRRAWPSLALGMALVTASARASEPQAPATPVAPPSAEPATTDDVVEANATDGELDSPLGPSVSREVIPVPPAPPRPRRKEKSGRGMLIAGGALLGLGSTFRAGIEGFWAGPAQLEAGEPFGRWSIPGIVFFTSFANTFVVPGLALAGVGARRRGRWRHDRGLSDPAGTRLKWRVGWGLLGGGLASWAITRAVAIPVLRSCETNGCAYGYLESTLWAGLGLAVPGVILVGLAAGERGRRPRRVSTAPMLGPRTAGVTFGGHF